jgi:hypothetical protein
MVKLLLEKKADINTKDSSGWTGNVILVPHTQRSPVTVHSASLCVPQRTPGGHTVSPQEGNQ